MKRKKIDKDLDTLLQEGMIDENVKKSYQIKVQKYKENMKRLKKDVEEKETNNTKKFINLPKDVLFQFGEYQIYVAY